MKRAWTAYVHAAKSVSHAKPLKDEGEFRMFGPIL